MSSKTTRTARHRTPRPRTRPVAGTGRGALGSSRARMAVWGLLAAGAVIAGLYGVVQLAGQSTDANTKGYPYVVGEPGPSAVAPAVRLPSTTGDTFELADALATDGPVLLYFQEGLTCQPCWDQLVAIEQDRARFDALGVGEIVSVTTDPLDLVNQKVSDMGITTPVLSDPDARVSDGYDARTYSMDWMRPLRNGHSFILVGQDGRIMWRADYGGEPDYTMFLPTDALLADLRQGLERS